MAECSTFGCTNTAMAGLDKCRTHAPIEVLRKLREEEERSDEAPPTDHRTVDAAGLYGCKIPGCANRSRRKAGPTAYLCDEHLPTRAGDVPAADPPAVPVAEVNGHRDYRGEAAAHLAIADALTAVAEALEQLDAAEHAPAGAGS